MSPLAAEELESLRHAFRSWWTESSPLYTQLKQFIANRDEILQLYSSAHDHDRSPLQLLAAVQFLVLQGVDHPLAEIYAAPEARSALEKLDQEFASFCEQYGDELRRVMGDHSIQTNEVNRCVGLLPALQAVARSSRRPLSLIELGASAGLNLLFDRYRYDYEGGQTIGPPGAQVRLHTKLGSKPPLMETSPPFVDYRVGIDIEKPNIDNEADRNWLRACIWLGDVAREQRFTAALELARKEWPDVRSGDATKELPSLIAQVPDHTALCIFTSYLLHWMDNDARTELYKAIESQASHRDIWWISLEPPGRVPNLPAEVPVPKDGGVLGLQHFDGQGVDAKVLAHMQMHGTWMNWLDTATTAY